MWPQPPRARLDPPPPLPRRHCYNQAINTGAGQMRERDVERKYFNRFAAKIYTILRESQLRHGQICDIEWSEGSAMEFQLICPLGWGQQLDVRWIKRMNGKCWRTTEESIALGRLSDYTGLHIFPHLCFQTSEIARQQIFAWWCRDRGEINNLARAQPTHLQPGHSGNFQCFIKLKTFRCLCFSSWRILSVACAHCIVYCSFDFDLFRSS